MKRFIVVFIVFVTIFSQTTFAIDSPNNLVEDSTSLLTDLGIFIENEEENDANQITRAEFSAILIRMLNIQNSLTNSADEIIFKDVSVFDNFYGYIKACKNLGIINGYTDGTFKPNDALTYIQAVKILVHVLGYDIKARNSGEYPQNYLSVGATIGLTSGLKLSINDAVDKKSIMKLVENALEIDLMEQTNFGEEIGYSATKGKNILTEKFSIYIANGQITGNSITNLSSESDLMDDEIELNDTIYKNGDTNAKSLLGYFVKAYYHLDKDSKEKTLVSVIVDKNKNTTEQIDKRDFERFRDNIIYYQDSNSDDSKIKELKISKKADLIYNNKAKVNYDETVFDFDAGTITAIDINNDKQYEVIIIKSYENIVVDRVSVEEQIIYNKDNSNKNLVIDLDAEYDIRKSNNEKIDLKDIEANDVLSVFASDDTMYYEIIKTKIIVDGEIVEKNSDEEDSIKINDKIYTISKSYCNSLVDLMIGAKGTFYLDLKGEICAFYGASSGFAYVMTGKIKSKGLAEKDIALKILTANGAKKELKLAGKLKVDGKVLDLNKQTDLDRLYLKLLTGGKVKQQLIIFEQNKEGMLSAIDFSYTNPSEINVGYETVDSLYNFYTHLTGVENYYKGNQRTFMGKANVDASTVVFIVPDPTSNLEAKNDDFRIKTVDYFVTDMALSIKAYRTTQKAIMADALVVEEKVGGEFNYDTPMILFDKLADAVNSDGETAKKMYGYSKGKKVEYMISSTQGAWDNSIVKGDVIRVLTNVRNEITKSERLLIMSTETNRGASSTDFNFKQRFLLGQVCAIYDGIVQITSNADITAASTDDTWNYILDKFTFQIYEKDIAGNIKVSEGKITDVIDYAHDPQNYSKVYIRTMYGTPQEMVIIKKEEN